MYDIKKSNNTITDHTYTHKSAHSFHSLNRVYKYDTSYPQFHIWQSKVVWLMLRGTGWSGEHVGSTRLRMDQ